MKKKDKRIYITGFMGTGKTTLGEILARKLGYKFIDIDNIIEKKAGKTIKEIFDEEGASYFREIEKEALKEILGLKNIVVSLGGGTLIDDENLMSVKKSGKLIHLSAEPSEIWRRVKDSEKKLLLKGAILDESDIEKIYSRISVLIDLRKKGYNQSDFSIKTDKKSPEEIIIDIMKFLNK
ncbi:shikimate kinase [candidate division KSB1 bacterium]|nr:MAG: shikimate kinase [candidate division KSB1 bacterium]